MSTQSLFALAAALLPALTFLVVLQFFDSYRLVRPQQLLAVLVIGLLAAVLSLLCNEALLAVVDLSPRVFSRYAAPVVEESIKSLVLIALMRSNRIGFLVDAAIFGFAVGCGFAVFENLYYLVSIPGADLSVWLIRGFGTAIMHGGVTAVFAVVAHGLSDGRSTLRFMDLLPGLLLAMLTHSLYNHFFLSPLLSTILVALLLPLLAWLAFDQSEGSLEQWLNTGFDADSEMLELINSGELDDSHVGSYLKNLTSHFEPAIVVDMLCYLRLYVELALRAKGVLMMRESGFATEPDPQVHASLEELRCLEERIGLTGRLAMKPLLHLSRRDLWQIHMLQT